MFIVALIGYIFFKCFFFKKTRVFIYLFWLCWVFGDAHRLSLVAASGGYSSLRCAGFSLRWLLLLRSTGCRRAGFSSCGSWAQSLWHAGLVAPRHVGSSRTRAWTRVPCIGRQILNHCATREVPVCGILRKVIQMNLFTKQKQTNRHRKQTYSYQREKGVGRDKLWVWD